ncbi:MAG: flagellar basal body P-ring formation chaperone FlgA [Succinivibrio sp.]
MALATQEEADFLSTVAKEYILAQFSHDDKDKRYIVRPGRLDPNRDYKGRCSGYLTAELHGREVKKSNIVIITCSQKNNQYVLHVPVTVTVERAIYSASVNIHKNSVVTENMVEKNFSGENLTSTAAVTNLASIVGSKARRDIRQGEILKQSDFCTIAKGDSVTIEAKRNGLEIKTAGTALEEGRIGDHIQVRNNKSKKNIRAVVTGPSTVQVVF